MDRVAVFVDAGYLIAQGSASLDAHGQAAPRNECALDVPVVAQALRNVATQTAKELLRIYWYDGGGGKPSGPSTEQRELAKTPDIKLRLGIVNSYGEQKGVDPMIVTDLIELGRNKAISDALVITGDEDIRIGLSITQTHGIRVWLLGVITAAGKSNQSGSLQEEADRILTWDSAVIGTFLRVRHPVLTAALGIVPAAAPLQGAAARAFLGPHAGRVHGLLDPFWLARLRACKPLIPSQVDNSLVGSARAGLGRGLTEEEARALRGALVALA